jgi:FAD/FMN-containing dehydrogenase
LSPLLGRRAVGACHFGSFTKRWKAAQHIVKLGPIAVELIDRTMLGLGRDIAMFKPTVDAFLRGDPEAILFVEFAEEDWDENLRRLKQLGELIGDLGISWNGNGAQMGRRGRGARSEAAGRITEVRTAGLNIMMSMKEAGKPVSFVEDCAVPLEHLADYTARLTDVFEKTAPAAPGMRMPRSAACMCVRCSICGSTRTCTPCAPSPRKPSRWCANTRARIPASTATASCARNSTRRCSARELVHAFEEVKDRFDPQNLFNPGKIVARRNSTIAR